MSLISVGPGTNDVVHFTWTGSGRRALFFIQCADTGVKLWFNAQQAFAFRSESEGALVAQSVGDGRYRLFLADAPETAIFLSSAELRQFRQVGLDPKAMRRAVDRLN